MQLFFLITAHILSFICAGHALLTKKNPRSALGWTALLVFLPVLGLAVYLIFGISRAHSRAEKIMRQIAKIEQRNPYNQDLENTVLNNSQAQVFARLGFELSAMPLCDGNSVLALHNGDEAYPQMLLAIEKAKTCVFLSTYIFNYGIAAREFIDAIAAARERGVDCRVLVDGIGALYSRKKPLKILAEKGVLTAQFRPPKLLPPNFGINLRSHRKVLICDETGFTGGMNIADGNLLKLYKKGLAHIQDVQFRIEGPVAAQLRHAFLLNWSFCTGNYAALQPLAPLANGSCKCRVIADGPGKDGEALYDLICGVINLAQKTVRIMTPYFLPPCELAGALKSAAQRGVDVKIILPAKNNLAYMNWACDRLLPGLLRSGVRVWRQPPPFAHTKLLAVDGFYSLVGSANLDSRSLKLNFELNMEVFDENFHDHLAAFMDAALQKGSEQTYDDLQQLPLPLKLRNAACWLFSPYF